jgi:hypothetical protein
MSNLKTVRQEPMLLPYLCHDVGFEANSTY